MFIIYILFVNKLRSALFSYMTYHIFVFWSSIKTMGRLYKTMSKHCRSNDIKSVVTFKQNEASVLVKIWLHCVIFHANLALNEKQYQWKTGSRKNTAFFISFIITTAFNYIPSLKLSFHCMKIKDGIDFSFSLFFIWRK